MGNIKDSLSDTIDCLNSEIDRLREKLVKAISPNAPNSTVAAIDERLWRNLQIEKEKHGKKVIG